MFEKIKLRLKRYRLKTEIAWNRLKMWRYEKELQFLKWLSPASEVEQEIEEESDE